MPDDPAPSIDNAPDSTLESNRPTRRTWHVAGRRRRLGVVGGVVLVALVTVALWQGASQPGNTTTDLLVGKTGKPAQSFTLANLSHMMAELGKRKTPPGRRKIAASRAAAPP